MKHSMKLLIEPFERIKIGTKFYEIRLNDEKRKMLRVGDSIEFSKRPELFEKIICEVTSLQLFPNFVSLAMAIPLQHYSKSTTIKDFVNRCYELWTKENETKYGVLAIGIKAIK